MDDSRPAPGRGGRARRDRRGRGLRSPLLPQRVPLSRTRAQQFDDAVLQAVGELERLWGSRLSGLEFAVDEVPAVGRSSAPDPDAVLDSGIPLARFVAPGIDRRGRPTRARVVIYRRPVEHRSTDREDLLDLVVEVLRDQVTTVLGDPPEAPD